MARPPEQMPPSGSAEAPASGPIAARLDFAQALARMLASEEAEQAMPALVPASALAPSSARELEPSLQARPQLQHDQTTHQ
jgi:hypothetical protein